MNKGAVSGAAVLVGAALLEVAGDAIVRRGLRGGGAALVALGFVMLGGYGVVVNLLGQDFSPTLGTYAGVFAVVSVLAGRVVFGDRMRGLTWLGLGVILVGCALVQLGNLSR